MDTHISRRQLLNAVGAAGGAAAVHAAATALGLLPAVARAGQLALRPAGGRPRHVLVIGAGIAGLTAAYELRRAGHRCTVLEASHRPGGRNLTLRHGDVVDELGARQTCEFDDHPDLYFNAGPARIPGTHTNLLRYCRELDVPLEIFVNENRNAWVQDDAAFGGRPIRNREYMTDAAASWPSCSRSRSTRAPSTPVSTPTIASGCARSSACTAISTRRSPITALTAPATRAAA